MTLGTGSVVRCVVVAVVVALAPVGCTHNVDVPSPCDRDGFYCPAPEVLYTFEAGEGRVVKDRSGRLPSLDVVFRQEDDLSWVPGRGTGATGLALNGESLGATVGPATRLVTACQRTNALTIEAWLEPLDDQQGVRNEDAYNAEQSRVVTLSQDPMLRNFTLGSDETAFQGRIRSTGAGLNGLDPPVETAQGSVSAMLTHLVLTRNPEGRQDIYVNGLVVATNNIGGDLSNWDPSFRLALANELTADRPWLGTLYWVAIYCQSFSATNVQARFALGLSSPR